MDLAVHQLLQQRRQLASGGPAQGLGIGQGLADLLIVYLQTVKLHRTQGGGGLVLLLAAQGQDTDREQVLVRDHHPAGGGNGPGPLPARHGAATLVQAAAQQGQRQRSGQGQGQGHRGRQQRRPQPEEPVHLVPAEGRHQGQHRGQGQVQRRQNGLPPGGGVRGLPHAVKALQPPLLLAGSGGGDGGHIRRRATQLGQAEAVIPGPGGAILAAGAQIQ